MSAPAKQSFWQTWPELLGLSTSIVFLISRHWLTAGLEPSEAMYVAVGCSLIPIIAGHIFGSTMRSIRQRDEYSALLTQAQGFKSLRHFSSAAAGLKYITAKLPEARFARNTRISVQGAERYDSSEARSTIARYIKETERAIRRGLPFKDVVTEGFSNIAHQLSQLKCKDNNYTFSLTNSATHPFINFCILEYNDNSAEVVFGWAMTTGQGFEQPVFLSDDPKLVQFFSSLHQELFHVQEARSA